MFARDMEHVDPAIRGLAATLLTPAIDTDPATVQLVHAQYAVEPDPHVRLRVVKGLIHVRTRWAGWDEFLSLELERENDLSIRLALRHAEVWDMKSEASPAAAEEM